MIDEESVIKMDNSTNNKNQENKESNNSNIIEEKVTLETQVKELRKEVRRLKIERDIYEKAAELIKKDQGINSKLLTNREKTVIINALRENYKLVELLEILEISKSSYFYQAKSIKTDKYSDIRIKIKEIYEEAEKRYGYRRIHSELKSFKIKISEKVVRRIMKEDNLLVKIPLQRKYNSYEGEISPEVENLVKRDFHAEKPNVKWLTDITEFRIPAGKVYLSPIIDCFDGLPVSWMIGTSPNAELVNTMLDEAVNTLKMDEKPIVHSDRGCHYRWPGWIDRMEKAKLTRSMSKKGCSPDNAACEGFFGRLKNEMFYGHSWKGVSIEQFMQQLNNYIHWYSEKRIKMSLGGMSPMDYRRSLGLSV